MHNISNLFYFGTTLYMFRTVSPSIRSLRLASKQPPSLYDIYLMLCMYSLRLLMMERETVRNIQSVVPK